MANDFPGIDAAKEAVERAVTRYKADRAALYTFDGKTPINAPDVHEREMARILEPLSAAVERAVGAADKASGTVEAMRLQPYADPTVALSSADLDDATRRAAFVAEDCRELPVAELAQRVKWVMGNGSKSLQWLYSRCGRARWAVEEKRVPQDEALGDLGAVLRDAGVIGAKQGLSREAQALDLAAGKLRAWARGQLVQATNGNGTGRKIEL